MATLEELREAIMQDDEDFVRDVLAGDPSLVVGVDGDADSPILTAMYRARNFPLNILLDLHPRPTADEAAALGEVEALRWYLDARPQLATSFALDGYTLLHRSAWFGRSEACALLIERGADLEAISRNDAEHDALHAAVGGRHASTVTLLLDRGANIGAVESHGYTPLHLAAVMGNEEIVQILLDRGADPNARADDSRTPGDLAYLAEHDELATLLRNIEG
ncbi:MAG: ankyrin repeat domain-containing protein [Chloroflexi bacterium]|nr:MAG: ankyrin repeat domain-containing protein [Chloroflexota bacterium]